MRSTHTAALALSVAALGASGCGGSSKTEVSHPTGANRTTAATTRSQKQDVARTTGKPLSRAKLIAKADAICARVNAKRASIKFSSQSEYALKVPGLAEYEHVAFTRLSALVPPKSMAGDWTRIVSTMQTLAADTAAIGKYAQSNNTEAEAPFIATATKTEEQIMSLAAQNGFKACAQFR